MNDKNRNLLVRVATALVALPIVVFLLWKGGYFSAAVMGWAAAMCAGEYYVITQQRLSPIGIVGAAIAGAMPFLPVLKPGAGGTWMFWIVTGFFLAAFIYHLLRGPLADAPVRIGHLVTGLIYAGAGLTALSAMRVGPEGMSWVLVTLAITWLNDTFAYFAGRLFGRHKLYPEVSPNKTWEGFFGGLFGSLVATFGSRWLFFPELSLVDCLVVGALGGIFGPLGDLCESMLKRAYKVKDSGRTIPGHGGVLDRIDALLFNAPVVFIYTQYLR